MDQLLEQKLDEYEKYIAAKKGPDAKAIEAYVAAAKHAYNHCKRDEALQVCARAKEIIDQFVFTQTKGGDIWWLEKQAYEKKERYTVVDHYYSILLIEARLRIVDSGFRYLEKKRIPRERFYMNRRKQLMSFGLIDALQGMIEDKYDIVCVSLVPGAGKAQPLYSKILTPNGFVRMGDIKVGDKVITGNGNEAVVQGVFPQGVKPIYEVTFDDGSKCRCSDEHLWTVQERCDRRSGRYRTVELNEIRNKLRIGSDNRKRYSVDYVGRINFEEKNFVIHPYVMGALLGDGGLTCSVMFTSVDQEIIDRVNEFLPDGYYLKHHDRCSYSVHGHEGNNTKAGSLISVWLKKYGLFGHNSYEKFIPKDYLYSSYEQRMWLLRGLLDTDGSATDRYVEYTTVSEQLADDIVELVHSLGGYASISKKRTFYTKDGNRVECGKAYRVLIQFPSGNNDVFSIKRKADKYQPKRAVLKRFITNVEYVGEEECQCIYIDDPSHLYITDDYIVTHNTTIEKFFHALVIGWYPNDYSLFYSHSGDITRMYYDGVYQIVSDTSEYAWHDIFPDLQITSTNAKLEQFNVGKYKPFPSLQCTSVGSNNAGKVRASKFLLVDDMIGGIEQALNKRILDGLWNKYTVDARQRKVEDFEGRPCKELHLATRWSVHDVIGRIMREYGDNPRVKIISVPDVDPETGESNFDYERGGFTKEFFADQQRLMDEISYRCLYKQEPVEREGLLYHEDELMRYLMLPEREPDAIIGVCDTKAKGTDYMALPCCYQYGDEFYFVDCVYDDNADFGVQEEKVASLILRYNLQQCQFESNVGGDRFAANVAKRVADAHGRCNITTKPTETNKETKIIVNADWVKKHIYFPDKSLIEPKSDMEKFIADLLTYTVSGKNAHDDAPDSMAMFALYITNGNRVATVEAISNPFRVNHAALNFYWGNDGY